MNKILQYERMQAKLGNRPKLPCDRRKEYVKDKLTSQQKIILQTVKQMQEATAFDIVKKKNLNAYSVSAQLSHLFSSNLIEKVRRIPAPKAKDRKGKSGSADCWVYRVNENATIAQ